MIFNDKNNSLEGILKITRRFKDGSIKTEWIKNLIVMNAREKVRDLVFSGNEDTIVKLVMGDCNVTPDKILDAGAIGVPSEDDMYLVHQTLEVKINEKSKIKYENRPAIKFNFVVAFDEGNGSSLDENGSSISDTAYYTEAGLAMANNTLFSHLKFKALTKSAESELIIDYYLLF